MHPADLLDRDDIPDTNKDMKNLERISIPLDKKMSIFKKTVETVMMRSLRVVTLEEIAKEIIAEKNQEVK